MARSEENSSVRERGVISQLHRTVVIKSLFRSPFFSGYFCNRREVKPGAKHRRTLMPKGVKAYGQEQTARGLDLHDWSTRTAYGRRKYHELWNSLPSEEHFQSRRNHFSLESCQLSKSVNGWAELKTFGARSSTTSRCGL